MAAGFGGLVLICVAGVSYAYASTSVPTDASQAAMQQQSTVYFSDGKTAVGTYGSTDRQLLQYNQISPYMRDAVIAAEDRSFYTEGGVSPKGIMRAAYEDVFNSGALAPGRLDHYPAVCPELLRQHWDAADGHPQDQGDLRRAEGGQGEVKGVDPDAVPEHHLSR